MWLTAKPATGEACYSETMCFSIRKLCCIISLSCTPISCHNLRAGDRLICQARRGKPTIIVESVVNVRDLFASSRSESLFAPTIPSLASCGNSSWESPRGPIRSLRFVVRAGPALRIA